MPGSKIVSCGIFNHFHVLYWDKINVFIEGQLEIHVCLYIYGQGHARTT